MRYFEFTSISEEISSDLRLLKSSGAGGKDVAVVERLKQLDRERLELITILVHRELRRHMSSAEYERHQLETRLGKYGPKPPTHKNTA
ncbi:hypothetical protein ACQUZK_09145 [Streptococcus pyogenes]|uniref:hypothetical protein n=1 Tax=Streptococcus pyogenes TaxID=1314 RepID=UPI003D9FB2E1